MVLYPLFRQRAAVGGAVMLFAGGFAAYPGRTLSAEAPSHLSRQRKPIYDDDNDTPQSQDLKLIPATPAQTASSPSLIPAAPNNSDYESPTDRLARQIRHARLFLYTHSLAAENAFNDALTRTLNAESRFTSTIASLAPSRESGERLLPGSIYVLVTAMAGSIISRNRGILLRTATPVAAGTIAAWTLLPVTMRNISDFVWEYEKKFPAVAEQHVKIRAAAEESWNQAVAHRGYARTWLEDKVGEGRETLEAWISKGK
ncbi:hypothetical protein LOZ53_001117 [Ophidiomyces ophidiicola]|uniref:Uncharacterized protein n=2 Tax=Ophidiomyces ophidiicola TaxID=1387563 RepID=A0ACB8UQV1_9EURO|nr:hypothetical protein LOZ61_002854 [Ophidiomyces ophidiicola]KAI1921566.1 hypothetical protein LOZ64_001548 [Ophidiomyces ophidiicola]KAI1931200.1 hypothetical protein LOZ60_000401 [Ophidiomyces ophidiicola]KAI1949011.1 hypothetical protein LOZ62_002379 [Ophidiomyces ophidiicola]KAI1958710.1 hypothetical protein LOZ59_003394 [Ophidiomyces ophidiicola]